MEKAKKKMTEEQEQQMIAFENKLINYVLPAVGLAAFIIGLVGFILTIAHDVGVGIFLLVLALLGAGAVAYGVIQYLKARKQKLFKEEKEPSKEPENKQ